MTQNIYDNPEFFHGYSQMNRSIGGLDAAPEWPALKVPAEVAAQPALAEERERPMMMLVAVQR